MFFFPLTQVIGSVLLPLKICLRRRRDQAAQGDFPFDPVMRFPMQCGTVHRSGTFTFGVFRDGILEDGIFGSGILGSEWAPSESGPSEAGLSEEWICNCRVLHPSVPKCWLEWLMFRLLLTAEFAKELTSGPDAWIWHTGSSFMPDS